MENSWLQMFVYPVLGDLPSNLMVETWMLAVDVRSREALH